MDPFGDISWTKMSTRCHPFCPRNVTYYVHEMSATRCPSITAAAACSTPPLLISILASLFFPTTIWSSCLNASMEPFESFVGIVLGAKLCQIKLGFDSSFFFFEDHSDEGLNWILQEINSTVSKTADVGCSTRG